MLKKWEKIEQLINMILEKLKLLAVNTFFKVVPPKFIQLFNKYKDLSKQRITHQVQKIIAWSKSQKELTASRKEALKQKKEKALAKFQAIIAKLKELKSRRPSLPKKQDFINFWKWLKTLPGQSWRILWFVSDEKRPYVAMALVFTIPGVIILLISGNEILKDTLLREPAAVKRTYKRIRPDYYHEYDRTIKIHSVNFPVYVESVRGARMLRMDLTLTTSNKYTRNYLNKNYHLVQDRLNSRLEPMIPTFPIEQEGKEIIKAKVREEIESLIKDLKIEGKVQSVHIHSILSG